MTNEEEQIIQNRFSKNQLNINGKQLNDPETLNRINQNIFNKDLFIHLCLLSEIYYIEYDNGFLFSKYHLRKNDI